MVGCENPFRSVRNDEFMAHTLCHFLFIMAKTPGRLVRRVVKYLNIRHNSSDCSQPPDHPRNNGGFFIKLEWGRYEVCHIIFIGVINIWSCNGK